MKTLFKRFHKGRAIDEAVSRLVIPLDADRHSISWSLLWKGDVKRLPPRGEEDGRSADTGGSSGAKPQHSIQGNPQKHALRCQKQAANVKTGGQHPGEPGLPEWRLFQIMRQKLKLAAGLENPALLDDDSGADWATTPCGDVVHTLRRQRKAKRIHRPNAFAGNTLGAWRNWQTR